MPDPFRLRPPAGTVDAIRTGGCKAVPLDDILNHDTLDKHPRLIGSIVAFDVEVWEPCPGLRLCPYCVGPASDSCHAGGWVPATEPCPNCGGEGPSLPADCDCMYDGVSHPVALTRTVAHVVRAEDVAWTDHCTDPGEWHPHPWTAHDGSPHGRAMTTWHAHTDQQRWVDGADVIGLLT